MARHMAARFHEFDPWQESGVAVKEPVAQRWRVPVFTDDLRTGEPRPRDFVVAALHQQFGPRNEFMVSGVVRVEMRASDRNPGSPAEHALGSTLAVWKPSHASQPSSRLSKPAGDSAFTFAITWALSFRA
jgi:hypothetical protein